MRTAAQIDSRWEALQQQLGIGRCNDRLSRHDLPGLGSKIARTHRISCTIRVITCFLIESSRASSREDARTIHEPCSHHHLGVVDCVFREVEKIGALPEVPNVVPFWSNSDRNLDTRIGVVFLFIVSPVKPARLPLFIVRFLGPLVFVLALTSGAYGLLWLYLEGIKRSHQDK